MQYVMQKLFYIFIIFYYCFIIFDAQVHFLLGTNRLLWTNY